eukprot:361270-Chlamydomonas_euryale.AAC.1
MHAACRSSAACLDCLHVGVGTLHVHPANAYRMPQQRRLPRLPACRGGHAANACRMPQQPQQRQHCLPAEHIGLCTLHMVRRVCVVVAAATSPAAPLSCHAWLTGAALSACHALLTGAAASFTCHALLTRVAASFTCHAHLTRACCVLCLRLVRRCDTDRPRCGPPRSNSYSGANQAALGTSISLGRMLDERLRRRQCCQPPYLPRGQPLACSRLACSCRTYRVGSHWHAAAWHAAA